MEITPESFLSGKVSLLCGESLSILKSFPDDRFDSIVTDPPYALVSIVKRFGKNGAAPVIGGENGGKNPYRNISGGFMGKQWDTGDTAHAVEFWQECLRVLKPGGHVVAFAGTRTYHRLACAIEDAGFEIRDTIMWVYGSGFPKSHDVSKGIDRASGAEREVTRDGVVKRDGYGGDWDTGSSTDRPRKDLPATSAARQWQGWGTALKPAVEPIVLARKPLSESTVAANVLRWGTGAINVDGCRVPTNDSLGGGGEKAETAGKFTNEGWRRPWMDDPEASEAFAAKVRANVQKSEALGRWPANLIHDGSEEVLAGFPETQSGTLMPDMDIKPSSGWSGGSYANRVKSEFQSNNGSAARFFYTAKADSDDRLGSKHPTVKPVDLMQWLVRLITPKGSLCLDPFAGTGTTAEACVREGMRCVLIERETEYQADIRRRMALVMAGPDERARESIKAKALPIDHGPLFGGLE